MRRGLPVLASALALFLLSACNELPNTPANATITVLLLIYHYAFQNSLGGDYGMAAALSVMLAVFLGLFTGVYFWLTRSWSTT